MKFAVLGDMTEYRSD